MDTENTPIHEALSKKVYEYKVAEAQMIDMANECAEEIIRRVGKKPHSFDGYHIEKFSNGSAYLYEFYSRKKFGNGKFQTANMAINLLDSIQAGVFKPFFP